MMAWFVAGVFVGGFFGVMGMAILQSGVSDGN